MLLPTLKALQALGGSANIDELDTRAIELMQLPEEMRNVLHKEDGTLTEVEYRLAWARTYLKKYGLGVTKKVMIDYDVNEEWFTKI